MAALGRRGAVSFITRMSAPCPARQPAAWQQAPRCLSAAAELPPPSPQQQRQQQHQAGRLNHVAVAVPNLQAAAEQYRRVLGAQVSEPQHLPEHGVSVVFVRLPNAAIELLHPLGEASPIANFLKKNPSGGVHHICLEVPDIQGSVQHVSSLARLLDPKPKIGAHGHPVVFMHPKDMAGVLIELEEVKGPAVPN